MQSLHPVSLCSQPNTHSTSLNLTLSTGSAAADEKFKAAMQTSSEIKEKKQDKNVTHRSCHSNLSGSNDNEPQFNQYNPQSTTMGISSMD